MRLYVRNDRGAQTYFEVHAIEQLSSCAIGGSPGRPVGDLFRAVVEPFRLGTLYASTAGGLWLNHVARPGTPQYVNTDLDLLQEACRRWVAVRAARRGHAEFMSWLYTVDPELVVRDQREPFTFWGCEYGDCVGSF